uniref:Uncharacterized protein n=1 Tax=Tanacetum cinerariifolium TaxID=118510 RepID=A0A6L2M0F6_TANCI|nr:hypothetical protein [Tanacetum cinerariifolium]
METKDTLSSCSNSEEQQMQQIQDKAKESCMVSFRRLHSYLKLLSNNNLKGTRTECGFKRAFATLFGQDLKTFTGTIETESKEQDTSSRSGNDAHSDDADIRPIYYEEPMAESAKSSILGKPVLQPHRNQSAVRQSNAFKSERPRISKLRFASQVDVYNDLSKPVTIHYLPKGKEFACAKPHHMIALAHLGIANDMVHNHYLEEAKKKTQKSSRNSEPSVMPSARSQSMANSNKPKPRINNQNSRNWPTSKSTCVTTKTVPIAEHLRNSRNFSDSKHFVCLTCQKCVFNANHNSCVTKLLNEVNSSVKVPSNKATNRNKPVERTSFERNKKDISQTDIAMTSDHNSSKFIIHDHNNEPSSSNLVPKVVPPADKTVTSRQELELLFHHHITMLRLKLRPERQRRVYASVHLSFALEEKSSNIILILAESDLLPHAHAQTTKTYYKHQDSRIKKAQELKKKTSANSDIKDNSSETKLHGRLLESFQDNAKYGHVGQDTRSQGGKDDQDKQEKYLKISEQKTKSKENDKG